MNKALILNGGGTDAPYGELAERAAAWARSHGYEPDVFDLTAMTIKPCRGCFGCWLKTPGRCLLRDGMDEIMPLMARADMLILITPVAWGGYGVHLKKALDRAIPILLPFFIRINNEIHHPLRYEYGTRRVAAIGVLPAADPESERIFHSLVWRNSINMHAASAAIVLYQSGESLAARWEDQLDVLFGKKEHRSIRKDTISASTIPASSTRTKPRKAVLLLGSPKGEKSTSKALGDRLFAGLISHGVAVETHDIHRAFESADKAATMLESVDGADLVVFSFPLYVDQLPAPVIWACDRIAERRSEHLPAARPLLATIVQCGFPETHQNDPALAILRRFADLNGFRWAGGLAMGMGGAIGDRPVPGKPSGMLRNVIRALDEASAALAEGRPIPAETISRFGGKLMPFGLYGLAANFGMRRELKKNAKKSGKTIDAYARPSADS